MTSLSRQPDDPGIGDDVFGPKIFVEVKADLTRNTLKTIRANVGKVPPFELADLLGWSFNRLKSVCAKRKIPLRYPASPAEREHEPRGA